MGGMVSASRLVGLMGLMFLSGCVSTLPVGVVGPDGGLQAFDPKSPVPRGSGERPLRFVVRVQGAAAGASPRMAGLLATHSPLTNVSSDDPKADVELRWTFSRRATGVELEAVSAYSDQTLFRCQDAWWTEASAGRNLGTMVYTAFLPGGPLYKQVMAERAGARPVAAAPAPTVPAAPAGPALPPTLAPTYASTPRPHDLAVIVGVESYSDIATKAPYAERDADAFKAHVLALGVPERNIALLKGPKAGKASIVKHVETWLAQLAKPESRVYFYFSGHGAPDVKTGQAYLVPWDGDPNFLPDTGVPLRRLYEKLGALPAKQVLVAMDSCFSGAGGRSVLASGARPLVTTLEAVDAPDRLTVLSASGPDEISGSLDDKGHGAFTYFLLEALNAGKATPKALVESLTPQVQDEARRLNRAQTPRLRGDGSWTLR